MKNVKFGGDMPSKGREVGARRRHEDHRACETRYRRIACLRFQHPSQVAPFEPTRRAWARGSASWSDVIAWRRQAARLQRDTRTPCSCPMCGNARPAFGDSLQERRAIQSTKDQLKEIFESN